MNIEVKRKFIGDRRFYRMLIAICLPIILQQFVTSLVGLLDNIMVGRIGNDEMIGVSLANQLIFIFNLAIFGSLSGAAIYATQYYGAQQKEGYQETFRFKWLIVLVISLVFMAVFFFFKEGLISAFINSSEEDYSNPAKVLESGKLYLDLMLIGLLPFAIKEIYATSLREMKETLVPMISGVIAIFINLILNYILIFGHLGAPKMGVSGAAIATIISRFVEMFIVIIYTHVKRKKFSFLNDVYKRPIVRFSSIKKFILKTFLLLSNETLWSIGLTMIMQAYSVRGLDVIGALNIANTVNNVFIVVGTSLGNATAIILGNLIGAQEFAEAKSASYKILFSSIVVTAIFSLFEVLVGFFVPDIYNTSPEIKALAFKFIIICSIFRVPNSFNTCAYFTLRAGGKILLTMLFDSLFIWLVRVPASFILSYLTGVSILWLYIIVEGLEASKAIVGYILVDKGIWLNQII